MTAAARHDPAAEEYDRATSECLEQARALLVGVREEIARADGKAAILLGAVGATGAALIAVLAGRQWTPDALPVAARLLWWAGACSWVLSLLLLLAVVAPRPLRSRWQPGRPLTYFGDIARADRDTAALRQALTLMARDPLPPLLDALRTTSRIARTKHRCVLLGAAFFGTAILAALTAVLTT
ncbi:MULTISPECIES: Pycsar system effector family protein [Kitasatospora]|uniref:Pycsar effector protein domain-containing protein n=2 Tax=Kitasatospora TaxID=2063 RepID=A0ABT1J7B1_9ACTN|nr:Pycsar system effector family protein [Kitasatospora paracochleata]MCP2313329.1 hypothetical protein [Kitasatospora paracochleata]